ncbi:MAG: hypothetical protein HN374_00345 [Cryomorphaceae bacterium]|jgi:hypothetical protein|nr:hypothetical protein [Cryomorphaceae bacterium]
MAKSSNQPKNLNYFIPTGFKFTIEKIPNVNFFCQSANLPGLSAGQAILTTPLRDIPIAGDKVQYNELRVRFIIDEELKNWLEVYDWIKGITFPDNLDQYKNLAVANVPNPKGELYSDGTLSILTSNKNIQYVAKFTDLFPVDLTDIEMSSDVADAEVVAADATFAYSTYNIERIIGEH